MAKASRMIDVGDKKETRRAATASGRVVMLASTKQAILAGRIDKGDVLQLAQVAAIMAAKHTPSIVPLCHPIGLSSVDVGCDFESDGHLCVTVTVKNHGRTGVEMEALTAVMAACLTVYDMCKSMDRSMTVTDVQLVSKEGGRSGTWRRHHD